MTPPGSEPERTFLWASSGMSWSDGEVVSLALKALNRPAQGRPGISGAPGPEATLSADTSGITDPDGVPDDAVFSYQWFSSDGADDVDIPGATGASYLITGDEPSNFPEGAGRLHRRPRLRGDGHQRRGGVAAAGRALDGGADRGMERPARPVRVRGEL